MIRLPIAGSTNGSVSEPPTLVPALPAALAADPTVAGAVTGDGPRVAIDTLGCKLNQAESEALARQFRAAGFQVVDPRSPAEVYLLNSCTVTGEADRKARQALRRMKRQRPATLTVLTGCYPSVSPEAVAWIGADLVAGNPAKAGWSDR